jgi:Uma2 family endonuclease
VAYTHGMPAAAKTMTLDEFLELPETEPASEFVCGRIIPRPMPTWFHSRLANRIGAFFEFYFMKHDEGYANVELRYAAREEGRSYLPDVSVTRWDKAPPTLAERRKGAIEVLPDLAVEISSPEDRPTRIADKLAFYLRAGVPLVWIVDADDRTVSAYTPGQPPKVFSAGDVLDASPVLSEFALPVSDLFSALDKHVQEP